MPANGIPAGLDSDSLVAAHNRIDCCCCSRLVVAHILPARKGNTLLVVGDNIPVLVDGDVLVLVEDNTPVLVGDDNIPVLRVDDIPVLVMVAVAGSAPFPFVWASLFRTLLGDSSAAWNYCAVSGSCSTWIA